MDAGVHGSEGPGRRTVLAGALAGAALLTGCVPPGEGRPARSGGGRVLAVKIDNVGAARPQSGLDRADLVYVEQVEGGLTRLMAVYANSLPERIGPVRSARETDLEILRQFDDPVLAFSGAHRRLLPLVDAAPLDPLTPTSRPAAWTRANDRPAPHNLYLRPSGAVPRPGGLGALESAGVVFGAAPAGGTPVRAKEVAFPAARFGFDWSASRGRWLISMDGTTSAEPPTAATVVLQYVQVDPSSYQDVRGSNSPYSRTVGSGRAVVLREGRAHEARWRRAGAGSATEFTTASKGEPVRFAHGPTWVVLAKGE